jgi:hypothetical protein
VLHQGRPRHRRLRRQRQAHLRPHLRHQDKSTQRGHSQRSTMDNSITAPGHVGEPKAASLILIPSSPRTGRPLRHQHGALDPNQGRLRHRRLREHRQERLRRHQGQGRLLLRLRLRGGDSVVESTPTPCSPSLRSARKHARRPAPARRRLGAACARLPPGRGATPGRAIEDQPDHLGPLGPPVLCPAQSILSLYRIRSRDKHPERNMPSLA